MMSFGESHMLFIVGVGIVLAAVMIIPRMRLPRGVEAAPFGTMSEQWSPDSPSSRFYLPMVHSPSRPHATAALLDDKPDVVPTATCPMCHTRASLTQSALAAGGDWRCVRCGQHWDAARLAAVAGYAAWVVHRDPPTERLDGTP
jgi:predicted Zn finger-like uncharacterized protein